MEYIFFRYLANRLENVNKKRGGRVVEGARLESVYTPQAYRGFESLPLCNNYYIFIKNLFLYL